MQMIIKALEERNSVKLMTHSAEVPNKANAKTSSLNLKSNTPDNLVVLERSLSFTNFLQGAETSPVSKGPSGNSAELMTNSVDVPNNANTKTLSLNLKSNKPNNLVVIERTLSFKNFLQGDETSPVSKGPRGNVVVSESKPSFNLPILQPEIFFSPRPIHELNEAAVKVQKVYKSYRTRRNLADCAIVVEELWWKAIDFVALKHSSVLFYKNDKTETIGSRWARARIRVAKVGKGLSKDEKAQKLALQHWLEAIDPRHRYGHNLHLYYDVWFESESTQPFFYWLDVGQGKDISLAKCPRSPLQKQCIKYLGPSEREVYEVVVRDGKLVYQLSGVPVDTVEGSKWIFVLSTTRAFYVGEKKKGVFQHSSFLSGAAITAAGRLVSHAGVLEAIWPYSGHYHPTEENFMEFISFLEEHHVDLCNVKRCSVDDDYPSYTSSSGESNHGDASVAGIAVAALGDERREWKVDAEALEATSRGDEMRLQRSDGGDTAALELARRLSCRWTTGTGPRIGCVRDYPTELQSRALEQVNLSPRVAHGPLGSYGPIPSPRPGPKYRVSPRLSYMGLPSPKIHFPESG